jgi:AraC-like DNA-binding protein
MHYLAGVGLAFFLALLMISKKNKSHADYLLAGWLLLISIHLALFYFFKTEQFPELLGVGFFFPLVHGPLLYLYTRALTNRSPSRIVSLLHFAPAVFVFVYTIPFLLSTVEEKVYVYEHEGKGYEAFNLINNIAILLSGIIYIVLSAFVLRNHRKHIVHQFSSTEKINLQWLQYLIYWIATIWIFVFFNYDAGVFGTTVLFILFIGIFGIRQAGIFHHASQGGDSTPVTEAEDEKPKYVKSGLSGSQAEVIHQQLRKLMASDKLYRESDLSLSELAHRLNTQPNHLSQVINEREGKNFYDYINSLRIEEFVRLTKTPGSRKYTLQGLAQECGFSSKSSFNRHFKKMKGMSPSEFMETLSVCEN